MSLPSNFSALVVSKTNDSVDCSIATITPEDLDPGAVTVKVEFSAINYKDGLASTGHPGVAQKLPLIPGIDAVGEVVESNASSVAVGQKVLIAAAKFGTAHNGGFAQYARVPADWVCPLPDSLSIRDAVCWGTAGFTAAMSVEQILERKIKPEHGEVLVTGATGGVGIFAVKLLARLGFQVVAVSGKPEQADWLKQQGAAEVITREQAVDSTSAPLLKGRWAAAVDTVGGATLTSVLRSAKNHACVTACGLVAGHELNMTVYPFILRGVTLCGIDSANISQEARIELWSKIASDWQFDLIGLTRDIGLEELNDELTKILAGKHFGRTVVKL